MLLFIFFISLLLVSFISFIIAGYIRRDSIAFGIGIPSLILFVISLIMTIILTINASVVQGRKDVLYQETIIEKAILEKELAVYESQNILEHNEELFYKIKHFNNKILYNKKWHNNIWLNWYYNEQIATIDYIDLS